MYDYYRYLTADTNNGVLEYGLDDLRVVDDPYLLDLSGDAGQMFEDYLSTLDDGLYIGALVTKETYDRIKSTYGIKRQ